MSRAIKAARRGRGRRAKRQGQLLEQFLIQQCELLRRLQRALVYKRSDPLKPVRSLGNGRFEAVLQSFEGVDFSGCLCGGRAVFFDAKATTQDARFRLDLITNSELEHLRLAASMGGVSFVYVRHVDVRAADYVLPIDRFGHVAYTPSKRSAAPEAMAPEDIALYDADRRESIRWDAMDMWRVQPGESWLDCVDRLQQEERWPCRPST